MKASELRIGNYVRNLDVEPYFFRVDITNRFIGVSLFPNKQNKIVRLREFYKLPLTEEWLLKLGFTKVNSHYTKNGLNVCGVSTGFNKPDSTTEFQVTNLNMKPIKLKSVHHLQNLYFALYSEELTLNPPN